jgi:L-aminopeptidase/D-esterase-like protein
MMNGGGVAPEADQRLSRRRIVQESALAAGALALGSQFEVKTALAQGEVATPSAWPSAGRKLEFDFPGLEIGVAAYPQIPTGCTAFIFDLDRFPTGVMLELDVRGGAPAYFGDYGATNAICLAGGSSYGLEAAAGVASELFAQGGHKDLLAVAGAIIYDVSVVEEPNGFRHQGIYPDKALGQEAVRAARPGRFPLGSQGAGSGAYVGQWAHWPFARERGGQGGAFRQIGPIKVGVFTVVNALGVIVDRQGQVVRGGLDSRTGVRTTPVEDAEAILAEVAGSAQVSAAALPGRLTRHTTLTVVVTNVAFPRELLRQMGRQVHSSMARAIQPFHTPDDGDILFTASTGEVAAEGIDSTAVGVAASELAWDAVLSCYNPST